MAITNLQDGIAISIKPEGDKFLIEVCFTGSFHEAFKSVCVFVGEKANDELYTIRTLSEQNLNTTIAINMKR